LEIFTFGCQDHLFLVLSQKYFADFKAINAQNWDGADINPKEISGGLR
jgi:hypothetical protein